MKPEQAGPSWHSLLPLVLLAVGIGVALVVYVPTISYGFLGWDDRLNILENPSVIGDSVLPAWKHVWFGMYNPVVQTLWRWLYAAGAGSPVPFRVLNIGVHLVNGVLVYELSRRVLRDGQASPERNGSTSPVPLQSALAATIFLLHPLQVGAVAWISGSRDVLATAFALLAVLLLLDTSARSRRRRVVMDIAATVCFAASILSKPNAAALPAVVLVLSAWPAAVHRIVRTRALLVAGTWSVVVAIVAVVTYAVQADLTPMDIPIRQRLLGAVDAIGFYTMKVLVPSGLTVDYGRTPAAVWSGTLTPSKVLAASVGAMVLGALVLATTRLRRSRVLLLLLIALLLLLPVLGLVPFSYQRVSTVADHYLYLPMAFLAMAVVCMLGTRVAGSVPRWAFVASAGAVVLVALFVSLARVGAWASDRLLFVDALSKNPRSVPALISLAKDVCDEGALDQGIAFAERAVAIDSTRAAAYSNLAHCLFRAGKPEQVIALMPALAEPEVVYQLERDNAPASSLLNSLAGSYFITNRPQTGWLLLCYALALRPDNEMLQANVRDVAPEVVAAGGSGVCERPVGLASLFKSVEKIGEK